MKLDAKHREFTAAYEYEFGIKWNWKNDNGETNHPLFSEDQRVRMFYKGWTLANQGMKFYREKLNKIERLEEQLKEIKKAIL